MYSVWNVHNLLLDGTVSSTLGVINDFSFASDNGLLTASDSGIFVEPYDASWALGHVCHIVNRNLTPAEWNKYLPGFDYKSTCPS